MGFDGDGGVGVDNGRRCGVENEATATALRRVVSCGRGGSGAERKLSANARGRRGAGAERGLGASTHGGRGASAEDRHGAGHGPGSCQQLHISQIEAGLPEAAPVLIDVDLMSTPSKADVNDNVDVLNNQDKSPLKVDLRSEAKMAAEENRRLSSGKKLHPFFASRKMNKCASQDQDVINIEDAHGFCAFERDPPFYPIHVAYQLEINVDNHLLVSGASCQASLLDLHGRPEVPQNGCEPAYYLWTDKYRPETAAQVCGNSEHVKFLAEWLKGWDERGHKTGAANGDTNDSSYQDESDADSAYHASDCDNVLLITGPVGCGKSAAVFACAREQGFNVIEVNTSDMRNGAYVRQKFEEATKSHGLEKWSQEEIINSLKGDFLDPDSGTPDRTEYQHSMSRATRLVIDCDQQKSPVGYYPGSKVSDEASKQVLNKTLILFEDVDTVFDEDRGFISTILKMAETTKWPIILTSNRKDPSLPNLLDQFALDFKYPLTSELLSHVAMICKSEGVDVTVPELKHVVDICLGDIRRTVMLLQFWYQGKQQFTERPNECLCGPFSLDLDAVHSTKQYTEVDKTILVAEEKKKQMEASYLEGLQLQVIAPSVKGRSAATTRKAKKSKLKRGQAAERNDISPCKNDLDDFHDLPDIPLPSDQQPKRNRHGLLLLSESDDDPADVHTEKRDIFTVTEVGFFSQPSEAPHIHSQDVSHQFLFPIESKETFGIADSFQNPPESNMSGSISQVCDTFMSQGVSCVPESSFIVEGTSASISDDEFLSRAVSNDLSTFHDSGTYTMFRTVLEDNDNAKNVMAERQKDVEDVVGETSEAYVESFGRNEQASCSTAGFQLMDECSRAESIWLLSGKKSNDSCKVEQVQDTWNRLRSCCPELSHEADHNRAASGALKLASGVSDLISELDLMLSCCYPLTKDMLDPSSTPCAEPDDFSWYNNQVEMGSVYAQHALCMFSRESQDIDDGSVALSQELLFASTAAISLGKIISSGLMKSCGSANVSHMKNPTTCISKRREHQVHLFGTMSQVVPSKLSQSLRGPVFVDYLSSIGQIARLENLRLSESKGINKQRRSRQPRHYLSSLPLSPADVVLLSESSCFSGRREKVLEQAPCST
uniref:AAA+ ATPase domain-containing protein n=1 Tax=Setaria italica TaxID=4555 RepID=K4A539_SETIT